MPEIVTVRAYAKLNLALEILGRRDDGYHEIVSVAQSISIHDLIRLRLPPDGEAGITVEMDPPLVDPRLDLAGRAATVLARATDTKVGARIQIRKRIPLAAGLGGGSADAAAVLHGLNRLWRTKLDAAELARLGAEIGSDVPFSLHVGAALLRGRGECVSELPGHRAFWLALACPPYGLPHKTQALYAALQPTDWTDGSHTLGMASRVQAGQSLVGQPLLNAFDRPASRVFPGFGELRERLASAAEAPLHLTGAGPALFALFGSRPAAAAASRRMNALGIPSFVARSVELAHRGRP